MELPQEPLRCCFGREKQSQKLPLGSVIWKDMRSNASNDAANFGKNTSSNCAESALLVSIITSSSKEELEMVGDLSKSLLSRRPENAFILARVTRHSMVCELIGFSRSHNGREFLWQTLGFFDFLHSQHE